jgi:hypothetical protein
MQELVISDEWRRDENHVYYRLEKTKKVRENRRFLAEKFMQAVKNSSTVDQLLSINTTDIKTIPGLEGFSISESSIPYASLQHGVALHWTKAFGLQYKEIIDVYTYQFIRALENESFDEVYRIFMLASNMRSGWWRERNSFKQIMLFPLNDEFISAIRKVLVDKVTSFDQALGLYNEWKQSLDGKSGQLAMEKAFSLAKTPDEHWSMACMARGPKLNKVVQNKKIWEESILKAADLIKKSRRKK